MNKLLGFLRAIFGFDQDDAEELMELLADFPDEDFNTVLLAVTMERDNRLRYDLTDKGVEALSHESRNLEDLEDQRLRDLDAFYAPVGGYKRKERQERDDNAAFEDAPSLQRDGYAPAGSFHPNRMVANKHGNIGAASSFRANYLVKPIHKDRKKK